MIGSGTGSHPQKSDRVVPTGAEESNFKDPRGEGWLNIRLCGPVAGVGRSAGLVCLAGSEVVVDRLGCTVLIAK